MLPQHIYHIQEQQRKGRVAILMEDSDPSHGHRSYNNKPASLRYKKKIQLHPHPAQSPDLNPIEGIWLLLQERLKQREGEALHRYGYWELRKALEDAWKTITMEEIQERIKQMPDRCKYVYTHGGARVRGPKW